MSVTSQVPAEFGAHVQNLFALAVPADQAGVVQHLEMGRDAAGSRAESFSQMGGGLRRVENRQHPGPGVAEQPGQWAVGRLWSALPERVVSELSPADQRPQYQGAFRLGLQLQSIVGPVAFTALAVTWGPIGWLAIAAVFVLAAIALGPAVGRHHAV